MAKKIGSVGRFGARYGRSVKHKLAKIEADSRKRQMCPYCKAYAVKKLAVGIWECRKCSSKFTGKAYTIGKRLSITEKKPETVSEEPIAESTEKQSFSKLKKFEVYKKMEEQKEESKVSKPIEEVTE
ncbi:50S ribosomal protein L37ae [Candidatus Woesearchaeota archaeon]|nr:50S ribosomal protein L37ae [Candidatus Woesearchaeota archaeon]